MLGLNQDSILTKYLSVMTCWAAGIVITSPLPTPSACPASQSAGMVHDHPSLGPVRQSLSRMISHLCRLSSSQPNSRTPTNNVWHENHHKSRHWVSRPSVVSGSGRIHGNLCPHVHAWQWLLDAVMRFIDAAHTVCTAQGQCDGWVSVLPYVQLCVSHWSTAAIMDDRFAANCPAGRRYWSIAVGTLQAPWSKHWCSTAIASSVTLTANGGGWTEACWF